MRKRLLSMLLMLEFMLCSYGQGESLTFTDSGFTYEVVSPGEVKVSCTDGFDKATMELPEAVSYDGQTYAVVENGEFAGSYYSLKELVLPKTIKNIDVASLTENMNHLVTVKVDQENPYFADLDGCLYSKDMKTLWLYPTNGRTGTLTLPEVDEIKPYAIVVGYDEPKYPHFLVNKDFRLSGMLAKYRWKVHLLIPSQLLTIEEFVDNLGQYYSSYYYYYDLKDDATGLVYKQLNDTEVSVVSYFGNLADGGNLNLPSTVVASEKTYQVTTIGNNAFYGATISSVTLPESLTRIGSSAFYGCDNLTTVDAHALNPDNIDMGYEPFAVIANDATLIVAAENIEAFQQSEGWSGFKDYVASGIYADGVFYRQLTDNTVEAYQCSVGETMSLPDEISVGGKTYRITSIAPNLFRKKSKYGSGYDYSSPLKKIRLPRYLEFIGDSAFYNTMLTEVQLPATISKIGKRALKVYNDGDFMAIFPEGVGAIDFGEEWIYRYSKIYVMPSTTDNAVVTQLKNYASYVYLCDALLDDFLYRKTGDATVEVTNCLKIKEEMTIPDEIMVDGISCRVTGIASDAFSVSTYSNPIIKKICLPSYLETIGDQAFNNNLFTEITIPAGVKKIGRRAFLKKATLGKDDNGIYTWQYPSMTVQFENASQLELGYDLFSYEYGYIEELYSMPTEDRNALTKQFKRTPKVNTFIIKPYKTPISIVRELETYASTLYLCDFIDDNVLYRQRTNGTLAYMKDTECRTDVVVPSNITTADGTSYNVTMIDTDAFSSSVGTACLTTLYLPASIDSLGTRSIYGNEGLQLITCDASTPPTVDAATGFGNYDAWLKVNASVRSNYSNHAIWSKFKMQIGDFAQDNISYSILTEKTVTIEQLITDENSVFSYVIPDSVLYNGQRYAVTEIASGAFSSASGDVLVLPHTLKKVADGFGSFKRIYLQSPTPPECNDISINVFILRDVLNDYMVDTNFWNMVRNLYTVVDGIDGGIVYQLNNSKATAMGWVGDQKGHNRVRVPSSVRHTDGEIYPVTNLGNNFMGYHSKVGSLKLPASITSIGSYALPATNTVVCAAQTPPTFSYYNQTSDFRNQLSRLYVKADALTKYNRSSSGGDWYYYFSPMNIYYEEDGLLFYREVNPDQLAVTGLMDNTVTEIVIPETVLTDDDRTIPVTSVASEALAGRQTIKSISLPTTLTTIGEKAFYGCTGITSITLPNNLREIGDMALAYTMIEEFEAENNPYYKVMYPTTYYNGTTQPIPMLMTANGKTLVRCATNRNKLQYRYGNFNYYCTIPDGVEAIAGGAFTNLYFETITIPTSVTAIGCQAFDASYIKRISLSETNTSFQIIDDALLTADTTRLIYFPVEKYGYYSVPEGVKNIEAFTFGIANLTGLTLPMSLETIDKDAFNQCVYSKTNYYSLRIDTLFVKNDEPLNGLDANTFKNLTSETVLYVPIGSSLAYSGTSPWNKFQVITSSELGLVDYALLKAFYEEMGSGHGWSYQWQFGSSPSDMGSLHGVQIQGEHVVGLNLSQYGMSGKLSPEIFNLPAVKSIDLSRNSLDFSVDSLITTANVYNQSIEIIDISNNKIRGNLGSVITAFPALTTLNAAYNRLSDVKPALPRDIKLDIKCQSIPDIIDFNDLHLTANLPTILTYDHNAGNYSRQTVLQFNDLYGIKIRRNGDLLTPTGSGIFSDENGSLLTANDSASYHSIPVRMTFESGDVNFDKTIDVVDLQAIINYAIDYTYNGLFNHTAADIVSDNWVNVQDVISQVNMLLDRNIDTGTAAARRRSTENAEADAMVYWRGNELLLASSGDIAAIDMVVRGENNLHWCLDGKDFDSTARNKNGLTHIVHYSLSGRCIDPGEVVLATADHDTPEILSVTMATSDARRVMVTVGSNASTSISEATSQAGLTVQIKNQSLMVNTFAPISNLRWEVCMLNGTRLGFGKLHALSAGQHELPCRIPQHTQIIVRIVSDSSVITKNILTN